MTVAQLQHAATASTRFGKRMDRELPSGSVRPFFTRILSQPQSELSVFKRVRFVAGGRFLLTVSGLFPAPQWQIQLWDLGFSSAVPINPRPLANLVFVDAVEDLHTQPTVDGHGIILLTEQLINPQAGG